MNCKTNKVINIQKNLGAETVAKEKCVALLVCRIKWWGLGILSIKKIVSLYSTHRKWLE